jgi:phospholipase/carboxylesterase
MMSRAVAVLGVSFLVLALVYTQLQTKEAPRAKESIVAQAPPKTMEGSEVVREPAKGEKQRGTILWLHGLGDDGRGWAAELSQHFRAYRIVCPNAPAMAVTANRGARMNSWFDMQGFAPKILLDEKLDPGTGMAASVKRVHAVLDREAELLGGKSRQLFVGGFSQGAALAVQAGLSYARALGGVVACSGWAVAWSTLKIHDANRETLVQLHHGKHDDVIPLPCSDALLAKLAEAKIKAERFVAPQQQHGFDDWTRMFKFVADNTRE